uniref:Apolipoprotein C-II n=3 Tax=Myotis myotis TaxID=51298 RepID=A0A7J7SA54_MYOMY|nr:apolipoprotein C2 [Myotis myotis]
MLLPGLRPRALAALGLCAVVLACVVECQRGVHAGTPSPPTPPPGLASSSWNLVREKVKGLVGPLVTKTRDTWQWFHTPDAMGTRYLLALFLILLVLGFEVQGAPTPRQDEAASATLFSQMQESLLGYWDTAKTAAQDLYRKTYLPSMDKKIRDVYSESTAAVTTYAGIFTDQVLYMLKGEE